MVIETKYLDVLLPSNKKIKVIFDAPHAAAPKREYYTGTIVREINRRIGAGGIISQVSRLIADLNRDSNFSSQCQLRRNYQREAIEDHLNGIKLILEDLEVLDNNGKVKNSVLFIALHGLRDDVGYSAIIGTIHAGICNSEIRNWFKEKLEKILEISGVNISKMPVGVEIAGYSGHPSLQNLRRIFGSNFNIVQLELSRTVRERFREEIITSLSLIALTFSRGQ